MFTGISLGAVVAIIAVIALLGIIASGYVKAPPDTAYIISGLRKKIIIGKSSIKIPFLERLDSMNAHKESLEEGIKFRPDEKYPELSRNELIKHTILAICL